MELRCLYCLEPATETVSRDGGVRVCTPDGDTLCCGNPDLDFPEHRVTYPRNPWNVTRGQVEMIRRNLRLIDAELRDVTCSISGVEHTHYTPCPQCGDVHRSSLSHLDPHLNRFDGRDHGETQSCRRCGIRLRFIPGTGR